MKPDEPESPASAAAHNALGALLAGSAEVRGDPSRYERLERIGAGGAGVVFRARDRQTGREVALKQLLSDAPLTPEASMRFRREADAHSRLSHPNIVAVLDVLDHPPGIVMELVKGDLLATLLARGSLGLRPLLELLEKVARAVHHAHENGVVHRDLKPGNILVVASDSAAHGGALEPKVMDFGIALVSDEAALTQTGAIFGTPAYMAPEQVTGKKGACDARTDVHALGAILFEILTGEVPFRGPSSLAILVKVEGEPAVPPSSKRASAPRELDSVALRALEKDPGRRYPTAAAFADALRRYLESTPPPRRVGSRARALLVLGAGTLLGLIAGARALLPERRLPGDTVAAPSSHASNGPVVTARPRLLREIVDHLRGHRFVAAIDACDKALARGDDPWIQALRADCLLESGDVEAALRSTAGWPEDRPGAGRALAVRAFVHERRGEWALARASVERSLVLDPSVARAWLVKGLLLLRDAQTAGEGRDSLLRDADQAGARAEALAPPCAVRARIVRAEAKWRREPGAVVAAPRAVGQEPEAVLDSAISPTWIPVHGDPAWSREDPAGEVRVVAQARWCLMGRDREGAREAARSALALNPHRAISHHLLALSVEEPAERLAPAREALARDSRDGPACTDMAWILASLGRIPEAVDVANAGALGSFDSASRRIRASVRILNGDVASATSDLDVLRGEHAGDVDATATLALLELRRGDLDGAALSAAEAVARARQVGEKPLRLARALGVRARVALARGDREGALRDAVEAVARVPEAAEAHLSLARVRRDLGDVVRAATALADALERDTRLRAKCSTAGVELSHLRAEGTPTTVLEDALRKAFERIDAPDSFLGPYPF